MFQMFVREFKKTHTMFHSQMEKEPELGPLLHDTFDLYLDSGSVCSAQLDVSLVTSYKYNRGIDRVFGVRNPNTFVRTVHVIGLFSLLFQAQRQRGSHSAGDISGEQLLQRLPHHRHPAGT